MPSRASALAAAALARVASSGLSVAGADLPALVEKAFGADVAVVALDEGFDGLAASSDEVKLIVLGTSQVPARQRFTLAHELGHLLAGDDQDVHLDKDVYDRAQAKDPSEMRANSFASAFLMPEDSPARRGRDNRADRGHVRGAGLRPSGFPLGPRHPAAATPADRRRNVRPLQEDHRGKGRGSRRPERGIRPACRGCKHAATAGASGPGRIRGLRKRRDHAAPVR